MPCIFVIIERVNFDRRFDRDGQFKCPNNSSVLSVAKPRFDDTDAKPKLADSSYMSTSTVASNSSRCCSQHRRSKKTSERPGGNDCASSVASSSVKK